MTVGTVEKDGRVSKLVPRKDCYGTGNVLVREGSYYRKSWSGGDSLPDPAPSYSVETVKHNVYDKDGNFLRVRTIKLRHFTRKRRPKSDNPYTMSLTERVDRQAEYIDKCYNLPNPIDTSGYPCYATSYPQLGSNEELACIGKLADKIGAGFNLAVFLAEGRQSLQTIAGAATRIYQALKALKKGDVASATRILLNGGRASGGSRRKGKQLREQSRDLASDWLQLQYGWKPLLKDIEEACKYLAYLQDRPFTQHYRASKKAEWAGNRSLGYGLSFWGSSLERITITAKITSVNEAALLGLLNPSAVVWEAVPFSFVADWFIPVGTYLEALNLRSALTGTFIVTRTSDFRVTGLFQEDSPHAYAMSIPYYAREYGLTRTVSSSLGVPLPSVKPLSKVATWQHAVNAVALIVQQFAR